MRIFKAICLSITVQASLVYGCGPWLPEAYVLRNDSLFYEPPEVGFAAELKHLLPESVPHEAVLTDVHSDHKLMLGDLRESLGSQSLDSEDIESLLGQYAEFRESLKSYKLYGRILTDTDGEDAATGVKGLQIPEGLPEDFRLYEEGAVAYHLGHLDEARRCWESLLKLPEAERQYRSVTAAFMLARTDPDNASDGYAQVRDLVDAGFADSLGLAAASIGREAQAYLKQGDYLEAIDLYLQQWVSGYGNAIQSLEITSSHAWAGSDSEQFAELAKEVQSRAVLTAHLLTQYEDAGAQQRRQRLLEALPDARTLQVAEAGRFALIEYQANQLSAARLWLNFSAPDDALALWVRSKLLLRSGKIEEGRILMLALTESFDGKEPYWQRLDTKRAWAELGLLYMREARYDDAAEAFWNADSWQDCAYVLERVMETDELLNWLEKRPSVSDITVLYHDRNPTHLAARRLMREARFSEALAFFSTDLKNRAETYISSMKQAHDVTKDAKFRAMNFWSAARIMRDSGMDLFGSELAPDHAWLDGDFDWGEIDDRRREFWWSSSHKINRPASGELSRSQASRVRPSERFHYRYRALQLAELAAGLLSNNDENAARIYTVSASWIQNRDPAAADRLFKQLAVRCPDTELGRAALENNWFPQIDLADHEPFVDG